MSDTAPDHDRLGADEAARLLRKRSRRRGLRQYRTIFLISSYWSIATLALALLGSVFHIFEVRDACAEILGNAQPVHASTAMRPPGVVVVCQTDPPTRTVEIPIATTALVIVWTVLGILTAITLLIGYRHVGKQIDSGKLEL